MLISWSGREASSLFFILFQDHFSRDRVEALNLKLISHIHIYGHLVLRRNQTSKSMRSKGMTIAFYITFAAEWKRYIVWSKIWLSWVRFQLEALFSFPHCDIKSNRVVELRQSTHNDLKYGLCVENGVSDYVRECVSSLYYIYFYLFI